MFHSIQRNHDPPVWIENEDFIMTDRCLGEGSFCEVSLIQSCRKETNVAPEYYALKRLKVSADETNDDNCESKANSRRNEQGLRDLELECALIQSLPKHDNIISLHGIGSDDASSSSSGNNTKSPRSLFLVLDVISMTVMDKINGEWLERRGYYGIGEQIGWDVSAQQSLWDERMDVVRQLSNALAFIHERNIIYRDCKPENIGFVAEKKSKASGHRNSHIVKLFDFGLAKDMMNQAADKKLTEMTGTMLYMSPEMLCKRRYGKETDVYSFALVTYYILTLRRPFPFVQSLSGVYDEVVRMKKRPPLDVFWPLSLRELFTQMWQSDARKRPSMIDIHQIWDQQYCNDDYRGEKYPTIPLWPVGRILSMFSLQDETDPSSKSH